MENSKKKIFEIIDDSRGKSPEVDFFKKNISDFQSDQFKYYPSRNKNNWIKYFYTRLDEIRNNNEVNLLYEFVQDELYIVKYRIPKWDEDHFGKKMAFITLLLNNNTSKSKQIISTLMKSVLQKFKKMNIEFVSANICINDIDSIHILESLGFRYFENSVYSVKKCIDFTHKPRNVVRFMTMQDQHKLLKIASKFTYSKSHYHLDEKFNTEKVDLMHKKWLETSIANDDFISVVEYNNEPVGYFIFEIDTPLSENSGYKYGRFISMALDSQFRGLGLGDDLFAGSIKLLESLGSEYIESCFSSRNLQSNGIHIKYNFIPKYEEMKLHLWLK